MSKDDYDMAVAWNRLEAGNPTDTDILLLHHELLESQVEIRDNLTAEDDHIIANEVYNWHDAIKRKFGENGEDDDLL